MAHTSKLLGRPLAISREAPRFLGKVLFLGHSRFTSGVFWILGSWIPRPKDGARKGTSLGEAVARSCYERVGGTGLAWIFTPAEGLTLRASRSMRPPRWWSSLVFGSASTARPHFEPAARRTLNSPSTASSTVHGKLVADRLFQDTIC